MLVGDNVKDVRTEENFAFPETVDVVWPRPLREWWERRRWQIVPVAVVLQAGP